MLRQCRQFASGDRIWRGTTRAEKARVGVRHHKRLDGFSEGDESLAVEIFATDFSSIVIGSLLATAGFGVIYSSAICRNISNEIVWESRSKKKKKSPKRRGKNRRGSESCVRGCAWRAERQAMGRLWRSLTPRRAKRRMARQVAYFEKVARRFCINSGSHSSGTHWHLRQKLCVRRPTQAQRTHTSAVNAHKGTQHWEREKQKNCCGVKFRVPIKSYELTGISLELWGKLQSKHRGKQFKQLSKKTAFYFFGGKEMNISSATVKIFTLRRVGWQTNEDLCANVPIGTGLRSSGVS